MSEVVVYGEEVNLITAKIKIHQDNVCQGMIEIGKLLIEAKEKVGHGNWVKYLSVELSYSYKTAQRLMRVAREFGDEKRTSMSFLDSTKIIALLDIPQEHRDCFIESHNLEDNTVRELKAEIKKYKEENGLIKQAADKEKKSLEQSKICAEEKANKLMLELEHEKRKPPKVETKIVEKVIEKMVDNPDYDIINKNKELEKIKQELELKTKQLEHRLEQEIANKPEIILMDDTYSNRIKELEAKIEWFRSISPDKFSVDMRNMSIEEIIADTKTIKETSKLSELNYIKADIETACSKVSLIEYKIDLDNEFVRDEVNIMLNKLTREIQKIKNKMEEF